MANQRSVNKKDDNALEITQKEVDQVLEIMRDNMNKVLERDDNLNRLETRAGELDFHAEKLGQTTKRIKKKYWLQNIRYWVIIGGVVLMIIAVIIIISVL